MFKAMLIAGFGGFLGTCLRFLVGRAAQLAGLSIFPLGTFAVNVAGSLLIGILFGMAERGNLLSQTMTLLLITGFCGGFTTFSSLADDIYLLLLQRHWGYFALYTTATFLLGVAMVWLGRSLVRWW